MKYGFALVAILLAAPASAKQACDTTWASVQAKLKPTDKVTDLTPGQFNFVTGAYMAVPPIGLPHGDKAKLITIPGQPGGVVFFLQGPMVCEPMPIPEPFVKALLARKTGNLTDGIEL
jgi:hypothetical protein